MQQPRLEARQVAAQAAEAASQQAIEVQVEAHRRDLARFYDEQGLTPDMYAQRVAEAGDNLAGRLRSEAQAEQLNEAQAAQQQQVVQQNQNAAMGMLTAFTKDLTEKHNLSEPIETALNKVAAFGVTRITEFQDANNALSPEFSYLGEAIAEIAAEAGKVASSRAETASAEAKKSVVPAGGSRKPTGFRGEPIGFSVRCTVHGGLRRRTKRRYSTSHRNPAKTWKHVAGDRLLTGEQYGNRDDIYILSC